MKVVYEASQPCDCRAKIAKFSAEKPFWVGTVIECDCGKLYRLDDDQRDGLCWVLTYERRGTS